METTDSLESIRRHIRNVCTRDQARWESTWKALLENSETARRGLVLPDLFMHTLEENSVFVPRKTARALVAQFQAPSGAVQATKFLRWIELSRPADHIDPELVFARLPQPYRRITKILEKDILDASWELITQQSVRFKAETAAALAATARSNGLGTLGTNSNELADDFDDAKKRCCKRFARKDFGDMVHVLSTAQHDTLPLVLVALEDQSAGVDDAFHGNSRLVLQLLHTPSRDVVAQCTLPDSTSEDDGVPDPPTETRALCEAVRVTPIRTRAASHGVAALVCGVTLTVSTVTASPTSEEQSVSSSTRTTFVFVYQVVGVNSLLAGSVGAPSSDTAAFQRIATGTFDRLEWMELSLDAQFLALPVASGLVSVFKLPSGVLDAVDDATAAQDGSAAPATIDCSATSPSAFMKIEVNGAAASTSRTRAHFVAKPSRALTSLVAEVREAYAIVVCHDTKARKYALQSTGSGTMVTPSAAWTHIAAITATALDATTRFLVVGLANGSVVIWDTLDEIDYMHLSAPRVSAPAATASSASLSSSLSASPRKREYASVSSVVMYRDECIVAFCAASQQVRFFDISKRLTPQLRRVVTPPAPSSGQQSERVTVVAVAESACILDIPVAMLTYSNGVHMLYDLRTAEAIGNVRSHSPPAGPHALLMSPHGVAVAQVSSLELYDWQQLLLTSLPSLEHLIQQRALATDADTVKRLLLSCFVRSSSITPSLALVDVAAESIDRLLHHTAGVPLASAGSRGQLPQSPAPPASLLVPDQRQASREGAALAAGNSSTSVGSRDSRAVDEPPALPLLEDVALLPSTSSACERFRQFCLDLDTSGTRDKDAKMHRRRTELLKTLTTGAW